RPRTPSSLLFPYTTLFRSQPQLLHHHRPEAEVEQVEHRVLGPAHVDVDGQEPVGLRPRERLAVVVRIEVASEVPARVDEGVHRLDRKSTRLNSSHLVISYA